MFGLGAILDLRAGFRVGIPKASVWFPRKPLFHFDGSLFFIGLACSNRVFF